MKLEDIQELWTSDCVLDDLQLDVESTRIPELHNKYFKILKKTSELLHLIYQVLDIVEKLNPVIALIQWQNLY